MIIRAVRLVNFRSHEAYTLECKKKTSLILGENGSGKTSVLEAIYECLRGRSFRATDKDILRRGGEYYRVELDYVNGEKVCVAFDGMKKTFLVDDKKSARLPKKNKYPVVLFLPDDLHLIDTSPAKKRDYFDRVISGLDDSISSDLSRYEKALKQRNDMLRKIIEQDLSDDLLFSWNIMLAKYGVNIRQKRQKFISDLNTRLTETYRSIAQNEDEVEIKYVPMGDEKTENEYLARLNVDFKKDYYVGHTTYGAHRDNFEFLFNQKNASGSASRGEVRSIILAMKFIEATLIFEETKKRPVVLLDDVFSELDAQRQKSLVTNFKDNQVIITSVDGYIE